MYQKLDDFFGTKKEVKIKNPYVYIWDAQKIHFRGPFEFVNEDKIELRVDPDLKKIMFINGGTDKHSRKFTQENKIGSGNISFKKIFDVLGITGTAIYDARKLTDDEKIDFNVENERVAYEIDLNCPITLKSRKRITK